MNLPELLKQMQEQLQGEMQSARQELAQAEVIGRAGAGLVEVTMTGTLAVRKVRIDPTISGGDRELLEDLLAAAFNDALNKAQELGRGRLDPSRLGIQLPPGFKLPF